MEGARLRTRPETEVWAGRLRRREVVGPRPPYKRAVKVRFSDEPPMILGPDEETSLADKLGGGTPRTEDESPRQRGPEGETSLAEEIREGAPLPEDEPFRQRGPYEETPLAEETPEPEGEDQ